MSPTEGYRDQQEVAPDADTAQVVDLVQGGVMRAVAAGDIETATELLHDVEAAQDPTDF